MEITYSQTSTDMRALYFFSLRKKRVKMPWWKLCIVMMASSIGTILLLMAVKFAVQGDGAIMKGVLAGIIMIVAFLFAATLFAQKIAGKQIDKAAKKHPEAITVSLSRTEVSVSTADMSMGVKWSAMRAVETDADYLYILMNDKNGCAVPRRAFDDVAAFHTFATAAVDFWRVSRLSAVEVGR